MTEPMATAETILEPELPIVDPHHHLWDRRSAVVDPGAPVGHPFEYVARLAPLGLSFDAWLLEPQPATVTATGEVSGVASAAVCPPAQSEALCWSAAATQIFPRTPPIRFRKSVPDCWIGLELIEGKKLPGIEALRR